MEYPAIPQDLKQAPVSELARVERMLRQYKNATILGIKHWRAIPQLCDAAKRVTQDQRRVVKEMKMRSENRNVPPPRESRAQRHSQNSRIEKLNSGDRVRSKFHNADGEVIRIEWSARVGVIYHVRLDNGQIVYCHVSDLTKLECDK